MARIYDTDVLADCEALEQMKPVPGMPEYFPRQTIYGTPEAFGKGLIPVESVPNVLIQPSDFEERIELAHEKEEMPIYHQKASWAPDGFKWTQNGLNWCYLWGCAAVLMDTEAMEGRETILLAPNTGGGIVNWQNRGYYLDETIAYIKKNGFAPRSMVPNQHSRNPRTFEDGWEEEALNHRPATIWDTRSGAMIQHCISILCYGRSLFAALNWWSHALSICGIRMENGKLIWQYRNSHGETKPIELTGSRAVPDEAYAFPGTVLAA